MLLPSRMIGVMAKMLSVSRPISTPTIGLPVLFALNHGGTPRRDIVAERTWGRERAGRSSPAAAVEVQQRHALRLQGRLGPAEQRGHGIAVALGDGDADRG